MKNAKREEIIAAMSSLLEQLVENEPPKAEPTTATPEEESKDIVLVGNVDVDE